MLHSCENGALLSEAVGMKAVLVCSLRPNAANSNSNLQLMCRQEVTNGLGAEDLNLFDQVLMQQVVLLAFVDLAAIPCNAVQQDVGNLVPHIQEKDTAKAIIMAVIAEAVLSSHELGELTVSLGRTTEHHKFVGLHTHIFTAYLSVPLGTMRQALGISPPDATHHAQDHACEEHDKGDAERQVGDASANVPAFEARESMLRLEASAASAHCLFVLHLDGQTKKCNVGS